MSQNRRKSRALIPPNAHYSPPEVRVGALTNKAAHNHFGVVRTSDCAVRVLTSICDVATDGFCRERRGEPITARRGVRNLGRPAHMREFPTCASAQVRTKMSVLCRKTQLFARPSQHSARSDPQAPAGPSLAIRLRITAPDGCGGRALSSYAKRPPRRRPIAVEPRA